MPGRGIDSNGAGGFVARLSTVGGLQDQPDIVMFNILNLEETLSRHGWLQKQSTGFKTIWWFQLLIKKNGMIFREMNLL